MFVPYRKFYADDAPQAYSAVSQEILTAMATKGVKTDAESIQAVPDIKAAEVEQTTPTETPKPETGSAAPEAKPAAGEQTPPAPPPAQSVPAPAVTTLPPVFDWKDEMRKVDPADVLKELGYDDKMVGFFNKWRTDGNISEYIRAISVDFGKMSPEQVMRYQLEQAYPEFSPDDIEELYQAKVVDGYKLNPDTYSETEVRRGKLLLAADSKAVREQLATKQQDYILSAKPPVAPVDTRVQQMEQEREEARQRYTNYLSSDKATHDLLTTKRMVLGDGENAFNYEIADPQRLLTILQDPQEYIKHVFQDNGSPIVDKQLFIAAAAIDHKSLVNELIKYGRSLGAKTVAEQIENTSKPTGELSKGQQMPSNPAEALAKYGVMTSNQY
jgi:hypothetical protein